MKIEDVKQILRNKIQVLENQRILAYNAGELEAVSRIDTELLETKATLEQIESIQ